MCNASYCLVSTLVGKKLKNMFIIVFIYPLGLEREIIERDNDIYDSQNALTVGECVISNSFLSFRSKSQCPFLTIISPEMGLFWS